MRLCNDYFLNLSFGEMAIAGFFYRIDICEIMKSKSPLCKDSRRIALTVDRILQVVD